MPNPKKISPGLLKAKTLRLADGAMTCAEIAAELGYHERQVTGNLSILRKAYGINWEIDKETKKITATYKRGQSYDSIVDTAPLPEREAQADAILGSEGAATPGQPAEQGSAVDPAAADPAAAEPEAGPELVARVVALRAEGATWKAIAEATGVPVARARRLARASEASSAAQT
jgi:hypothetical protein